MLYDPSWKVKTPVQQALLDAAGLIEREGWIRHQFKNDKGYCVLGAVADSALNGPDYQVAVTKVMKLTGGWSIPRWNDHPGRTKEEVVTVLRAAAQL